MRRFVLWLPVLLVLVVGLLASEDRKSKTAPEKAPAKEGPKTSKPVSLFDVDEFIKEYDRNKDGFLSKDELPERFRHLFDKLDTDRDGKISRAELEKGVAHLQVRRRPSDFVFVLVEMSDCDECCAEELQEVYAFLRKLDRNNNGLIEADELKKARAELVDKRVEAIFRDLDADKDGKISKDEARGFIRRHFKELDTNGDGFLSREELSHGASAVPGGLKKEAPKSPPLRKE